MKEVNGNEWADQEYPYKTCQTAITDEPFFSDTGVNVRGENEWPSKNGYEMTTVS